VTGREAPRASPVVGPLDQSSPQARGVRLAGVAGLQHLTGAAAMSNLASKSVLMLPRCVDAMRAVLKLRRQVTGTPTDEVALPLHPELLWGCVKADKTLLLIYRVVNRAAVLHLWQTLWPEQGAPTAGVPAQFASCLVAYLDKSTSASEKALEALLSGHGVRVEVFGAAELVNDPLTNCMVPTYRILPEAQVEQLRARYGDLDRFPTMLCGDPVARRFGASVGTVFEITRRWDQEEILYRVVRKPVT